MAGLDFIYALWCILEVSGSQCVILHLPVNTRGRSSWKHKGPWFGALFPTANPWLTCAWNMHSSYLYGENLIIHKALIPQAMWDYPLRSTSLLFIYFFWPCFTGGQPHSPCCGSVEFLPLNHQGISYISLITTVPLIELPLRTQHQVKSFPLLLWIPPTTLEVEIIIPILRLKSLRLREAR